MTRRNEFNAGRALAIRMMDAVNKLGGGAGLMQPLIDSAFHLVKDASVERMRRLGGYSAVLTRLINESHVAEEALTENQIIRSYLISNLDVMRERVQIRKANYSAKAVRNG